MSQQGRLLLRLATDLSRHFKTSTADLAAKPRASEPLVSKLARSKELQPVPEKEDTWVAVKDPKTNDVYYWNKTTDETTAVGEPRPGPEGRRPEAPTGGSSLLGLLGMGAGVGLVFGVLGRLM